MRSSLRARSLVAYRLLGGPRFVHLFFVHLFFVHLLTVPVHRGSHHRRRGPAVKRNLAHRAAHGDRRGAAPLRRRELLGALLEPPLPRGALRAPLRDAPLQPPRAEVSTSRVRLAVALHPLPRGIRPRSHRQPTLALPEHASHVIPEDALAASRVHDVPPPRVQHVDPFLHHATHEQKRDGLLAFPLNRRSRRVHAPAEFGEVHAQPRAAPGSKNTRDEPRASNPDVRVEDRERRAFHRVVLGVPSASGVRRELRPRAMTRRAKPPLPAPRQTLGAGGAGPRGPRVLRGVEPGVEAVHQRPAAHPRQRPRHRSLFANRLGDAVGPRSERAVRRLVRDGSDDAHGDGAVAASRDRGIPPPVERGEFLSPPQPTRVALRRRGFPTRLAGGVRPSTERSRRPPAGHLADGAGGEAAVTRRPGDGLGPTVERGGEDAVGHLRERGVDATSLARELDDAVAPPFKRGGQELVAKREQEPLRASHLSLPDFAIPLLALDGCLFGVEHLVPVEEVVGECVVLEAEDAPRHLDLTLPDPSRHLPPSGERGEEHSGVHTHGELASELHLGLPARFGANLVEPIKEGDGDLALRDARRHSRSDDAQPSDVGDVLIPSVKRRDQPLPGHPSHRVGEHSPLIPEVLGPSEPHREVSPLVPALHRKQEPLGFLHTRQPLALLRAPALVLLVGEVNPRVEGRLLVTTRELGERPRHDRPLTPHLDGDVAPLLEAGNHGALAHPGDGAREFTPPPGALRSRGSPSREASEEILEKHGAKEPLRSTNLPFPLPRLTLLVLTLLPTLDRERLPVDESGRDVPPEHPLDASTHLLLLLPARGRELLPPVKRGAGVSGHDEADQPVRLADGRSERATLGNGGRPGVKRPGQIPALDSSGDARQRGPGPLELVGVGDPRAERRGEAPVAHDQEDPLATLDTLAPRHGGVVPVQPRAERTGEIPRRHSPGHLERHRPEFLLLAGVFVPSIERRVQILPNELGVHATRHGHHARQRRVRLGCLPGVYPRVPRAANALVHREVTERSSGPLQADPAHRRVLLPAPERGEGPAEENPDQKFLGVVHRLAPPPGVGDALRPRIERNGEASAVKPVHAVRQGLAHLPASRGGVRPALERHVQRSPHPPFDHARGAALFKVDLDGVSVRGVQPRVEAHAVAPGGQPGEASTRNSLEPLPLHDGEPPPSPRAVLRPVSRRVEEPSALFLGHVIQDPQSGLHRLPRLSLGHLVASLGILDGGDQVELLGVARRLPRLVDQLHPALPSEDEPALGESVHAAAEELTLHAHRIGAVPPSIESGSLDAAFHPHEHRAQEVSVPPQRGRLIAPPEERLVLLVVRHPQRHLRHDHAVAEPLRGGVDPGVVGARQVHAFQPGDGAR